MSSSPALCCTSTGLQSFEAARLASADATSMRAPSDSPYTSASRMRITPPATMAAWQWGLRVSRLIVLDSRSTSDRVNFSSTSKVGSDALEASWMMDLWGSLRNSRDARMRGTGASITSEAAFTSEAAARVVEVEEKTKGTEAMRGRSRSMPWSSSTCPRRQIFFSSPMRPCCIKTPPPSGTRDRLYTRATVAEYIIVQSNLLAAKSEITFTTSLNAPWSIMCLRAGRDTERLRMVSAISREVSAEQRPLR
mmetsp:Transcript_5653/g.12445  ORF Transcript_5653/g.12445 Transcript_5653/m.12445 type:complete len:251 (-) Transcript_5653:1226-1978(-)